MSVVFSCYFVFFFKQKTAYEMRISDWSSDVCSSDLLARAHLRDLQPHLAQRTQPVEGLERGHHDQPEREQQERPHQRPPQHRDLGIQRGAALGDLEPPPGRRTRQLDVALDRKSTRLNSSN